MNKGKSLLEHDLDIINRMQDVLAKRFFTYDKSIPEEDGITKQDTEHLSDLASRVGYLVNVAVAVEKAVRLEQRLSKIEKKLSHEEKESVFRMFEDPISIQTYYR